MKIRELKCILAFLELRITALPRFDPHREKLSALIYKIREQLKVAEEQKIEEKAAIDMIRSQLEERLENPQTMLRAEQRWMEELIFLLDEM